MVAADTYRAAGIQQLRIWADRLNINLTTNEKSGDPASVAYDGVSSGIKKDFDRIIVDTSGRIHNSPNLMIELEKIYRVVIKLIEELDVLMTIDENRVLNALYQAKEFSKYIQITGVTVSYTHLTLPTILIV